MENSDRTHKTFRELLSNSLGCAQNGAPSQLSPLVLAFVGDTVFDLAIRTLMIDTHDAKVNKLHLLCALRAKASAQAQAANVVFEKLTQQEQDVFMRARNSKPKTIAKNATLQDYCLATGLEAVIGFLFLSNEQERLLEIVSLAVSAQDEPVVVRPKAFRR